jgi:hypothetical protein
VDKGWTSMTPPKTRHVIHAVHFPPSQNDGPCECVCGWLGWASDFSLHRTDLGLTANAPLRAVDVVRGVLQPRRAR